MIQENWADCIKMRKITRKYTGQIFYTVFGELKKKTLTQWNFCVVCAHDTPNELSD